MRIFDIDRLIRINVIRESFFINEIKIQHNFEFSL